tara:strand:- start:200 stop:382 length:183 start_codon:yes stop_codon:yes gene_type:complete
MGLNNMKTKQAFYHFHDALEILINYDQQLDHFIELYGKKSKYPGSDLIEFIFTINGYKRK